MTLCILDDDKTYELVGNKLTFFDVQAFTSVR